MVAVAAPGLVERVIGVEEDLRRLVRALDPERIAPADAARLVERFAAVRKLADGAVTLLAARAAQAGDWRRRGAASPAHDLAKKTGTSVRAAHDTLDASEKVGSLPATGEAMRRGELSAEQAAAVAAGAAADPAAEQRLLDHARHGSLANLREEAERVKAAARPDDSEERHRRIHASRFLRFGRDRDGAGTGAWRVTPEVQAELVALIRPFIRARFETARLEGRREPPDAYAADGLLDLARAAHTPNAAGGGGRGQATGPAGARTSPAPSGEASPPNRGADHSKAPDTPATSAAPAGTPPATAPTAGAEAAAPEAPAPAAAPAAAPPAAPRAAPDTPPAAPDTPPAAPATPQATPQATPATAGSAAPRPKRAAPLKVIVRIDHTALLRGHTVAGETCEIAGVGPVPVSVIVDLLATGDAFLAAIVTRGVDVATVAHLGRRPSAHQLTALQWRDRTCRIEHCAAPVAEWDHHTDWADTHHTHLAHLGGLCATHHDQKTYQHYRLARSPLPGKLRLLPPDTHDPP